MHKKKKILFVGSFLKKSLKGSVGGQMYACNTLINSSLSDEVDWLKIDTTAESNLHIPFYKRLLKATTRLSIFLYSLCFKKVDVVLIFSSNGFSFIEKGIMVMTASLFSSKKIIYAPRSGRLINEMIGWRLTFAKKVFKRSDHIICQGESWKTFFNNNVLSDNSSKYVIIKNWLKVSDYIAKDSDNEILEILFLAWIERDKGIFDLINAIDRLIQKGYVNFKLSIAGKGKDEVELKKLVTDLGLTEYIIFKGWVLDNKKLELLTASDIFVLPSYFEGSPNALLEAMSSGLSCIATNVGAIPDILDNTNGLIFSAGDSELLENHLELLINNKNKRKEISSNAISYVKLNHDISIAITKFRRILN